MIHLVRFSLRNRTVIILLTLIVMCAGSVSLFRLNQEYIPDFSIPDVLIVTADPGASPDAVDRDISQPIQTLLEGTPHLQHVETISNQGFSEVAAIFDLDISNQDAENEVNRRLQGVALPPAAGHPQVQSFSFTALPSMTYVLTATDDNLVRATDDANSKIAPAIKKASGVGQVKVVGGEQTRVVVTLDPAALARNGVSVQQVSQALGAAGVDLPVGEVLDGTHSVPVEVTGGPTSVTELKQVVVGVAPAGPSADPRLPAIARPIRLSDVAQVEEQQVPVQGISRTDGHPSLSIQVVPAAGANQVSLSRQVRDQIAKLHLDSADHLVLVSDSADNIQSGLRGLSEEGLIGAVLAILVIFLFLRSLQATAIAAVSLPTSVMVALVGTYALGYSLNILTLAGLTIAVGRIVDDAIVVLENTYRHLALGEDRITAIEHGAGEVSSAITSSTLTTVAVFLPIGFASGIISRVFLPFSITVTISLLASLLVSLTVIPVLASYFLRPHQDNANGRWVAAYRSLLGWVLSSGVHKAIAILLAFSLLAGAGWLQATYGTVNFFAFGGSSLLTGTATLAPGTSIEETSSEIQKFEQRAESDPEVKLVSTTVGSNSLGPYALNSESNVARLTILLKDKQHTQATQDRLQKVLDDLYGKGNSQLGAESAGGPTSNSFVATLSGDNLSDLRASSDAFVADLQNDSELTNVKSSLSSEKPELDVAIDPRRAAAHGLAPKQIAGILYQTLNGQTVGELDGTGEKVDVRIDPTKIDRQHLSDLLIAPGTKLGDVADVQDVTATDSVIRMDGTRQVQITADIKTQDTSGANARAVARLKKVHIPGSVNYDPNGGTQAEINDTFGGMIQAMGIAIAIVFLILVGFFRSVRAPFVILLSMPLALVGAFAGLLLAHQALGLPGMLGILMVFGIVVSNAILLIDFATKRQATSSVRDALIEAGGVRLRPILMTAVATVVALLPIAVGLSDGGGGLISQSLAVIVESGLISSTGLTLIVIPAIYAIFFWQRRRPAGIEREQSPD